MKYLKLIIVAILLLCFMAAMPQSYTFSSIDKCTDNGWEKTTVNGSVTITEDNVVFTINDNAKVLYIIDNSTFITPLDNRYFCCDEDYNTIIIRIVHDNYLKQNADLVTAFRIPLNFPENFLRFPLIPALRFPRLMFALRLIPGSMNLIRQCHFQVH